MTSSFKALRLHQTGNPVDVLQVDDLAIPPLLPNEVCIRVHSFALNRADWLYCRGQHYTMPACPSRVGSECAGVIERTGAAVTSVRVGDRVSTVPFDTVSHGVQGELAIVPADYIAPWPEELNAIEAASVWMQYLTAYFALVEIGAAVAGDYVLIPAACSSAGLGGVQIAKRCGATVIATTRSHNKVDILVGAGADEVLIINAETHLAQRLMQLTNGIGVRLVYDPVAGSFMRRYLGGLARHARLFIYGLLSGEATQLDIVPLVRRAAIIHPYSMFNHVCEPDQLQRGIAFVLNAIRDGGLRPIIGSVFPFAGVIDAYREMDAESHYGKIVIDMAA